MLENPVLNTVVILAGLFLPFLALVSINTEYFSSMFKWDGNAAKLASSGFGVGFGGLIALAYFVPGAAVYVGLFIFLDICWVGPSGGHDLLIKFAGRIGKNPES